MKKWTSGGLKVFFFLPIAIILMLSAVSNAIDKKSASVLVKEGNPYPVVFLDQLPNQAALPSFRRLIGSTSKINNELVLIVEILEQEWQNNAWADRYRQTMELDLKQSALLRYLIETWNGTQWLPQERMTTKRDEAGRITEMTYERYNNGSWFQHMVTMTSFRADGKTAETITHLDTNNDGFVEASSKIEYVYDDHAFLIKEKHFLWQVSYWQHMQNVLYVNNDKGWVVERYHEWVMDTGTTMPVSKNTYEYDASGRVLVRTDFTFDFASLSFLPTERTLWAYDGTGQAAEIIDQRWNGAGWVNDHRQLLTHDAAGNETLWVWQEWTGAAWADVERIMTLFNKENQPVEVVEQVFEGEWRNRSREVYSYRVSSQVAAQPQVPQKYNLYNYPNPFNSSTSVTFALNRPARISLEIYDAHGRLVRILLSETLVQPGRHELHWDGTDQEGRSLSSGVYFIKLTAEGERQIVPSLLLK
ncbi:MAG: T9SS type A sorting domain-containing protein [candidate division KSB1 bacterium]|nr:T9SS type A sorting domain-containing protein [candidate division KSB1 bacterium]